MLQNKGKISFDDIRKELNIKNSINLGDRKVRMLAGQNVQIDPKDCDYYFESKQDLINRLGSICDENNYDLSKKTFGFSDSVIEFNSIFCERPATSITHS